MPFASVPRGRPTALCRRKLRRGYIVMAAVAFAALTAASPAWERVMQFSNIALLLSQIDQAYDKKSWHGPNLKGSIRGLELNELVWRPSRARHNIWEQTLHAMYWKYVVWRRMTGEKRGSFPYSGSNWFPRDADRTMADWRKDVKLLDETHQRLRAEIAKLSPSNLDVKPAGSKVSNLMIISGVANHDIYHAGQIQLLKRLYRDQIEN